MRNRFGFFATPAISMLVGKDSVMSVHRKAREMRLGKIAWQIAGVLLLVACAALPSRAQTETFYGPFAYVTNQNAGTVSVISTVSNTVAATISLCGDCGPEPTGLAVTPNGQFVYVANQGNGTVSVISTSTNTVTTTISLPSVCDCSASPVAVAITPDGTRAYVTDTGQSAVFVIDTNPSDETYNTVIASITEDVGNPNPSGAIAISPDGSAAYYTFGTTSVGRIDTNPSDDSYNTHTTTITVGNNPTGVAVTPNGSFIYVANSTDGTVSVIPNTFPTFSPITTVTVGAGPSSVAITPNGTLAYVVNQGGRTVSVINTTTNTVTATVSSGFCGQLNQIAIAPNGTDAYVADATAVTGQPVCTQADVITTSSNTVTGNVTVGDGPFGVAVGSTQTQTFNLLAGGGSFTAGVPINCGPLTVPCSATYGVQYPALMFTHGETVSVTFNQTTQAQYAALVANSNYKTTMCAPVTGYGGNCLIPTAVVNCPSGQTCTTTAGLSYQVSTTWLTSQANYCSLMPHLLRADPAGGPVTGTPYTTVVDTINPASCMETGDPAAGTKGQSSCTSGSSSSSCLSDWPNAFGPALPSGATASVSIAYNSTYALNQSAPASFTCTGTYVTACTGTVTQPDGSLVSIIGGSVAGTYTGTLPTSEVGTYTLSVTAEVGGGSSANETVQYTVGLCQDVSLTFNPTTVQVGTSPVVTVALQSCNSKTEIGILKITVTGPFGHSCGLKPLAPFYWLVLLGPKPFTFSFEPPAGAFCPGTYTVTAQTYSLNGTLLATTSSSLVVIQ